MYQQQTSMQLFIKQCLLPTVGLSAVVRKGLVPFSLRNKQLE